MKKIDKKKLLFYVEYTAIFAVFMFAILYFYRSNGKAIVHNSNDGFKQNYRALLYISNYLKKIVNNIFVTHTFVIPQWDFVIGEGADILETFHYYGLGDPINLLSVFFNESNLYIFHDLSIFLRMYLAGIVFSCLCFYKKHDNHIVVLTGTILYAYCSYAFRVMTNYIYFLNPLIYFPLVILGVEKLIDDNKGILLTIAVALSAITSIYFFYMIVVATVLYVAIRILVINDSFKNKCILLLNIFIYSLFGVLIGAIIFFPSAYSMLSNSRTLESVDIIPFYGFSKFVTIFRDLIFNGFRGAYFGGYSVLGFFGIITIVKNRKNKLLSWLLLLALAIMGLPILGSIFNAMTYITERHEFIIGLLVMYCIVVAFEDFSNISKDMYIYLLILIVYLAVGIYQDPDEKMTYFVHFILGIGTLLCFRVIKSKKLKTYIYLLAAIGTLSFTIAYKYLPNYWNHAYTNGSDISVLTNIHNEEPSVLNDFNDDSFYRYSGSSLGDNICVNHSKSSTGYYWSVANNNIADFRTSLGYHDISNFYITDYDGDCIPNSLAGVKYYFVKEGDIIPYGYELYKEYDNYDLYINHNALPIMYGYDECISLEDYNSTNLLDRQQLLTKYVVVNDDNNVQQINIDDNYINVDCQITTSEGIDLTNNSIEVSKGGESIELAFSSSETGEYYFVIEGVTPNLETELVVKSKDATKSILTKNHNSHAYGGRHNFAVNLGYYEDLSDTVSLIINSKSSLTYESMRICCLPVDKTKENIEKLNCININDLIIEDNRLIANIETNNDKYLCMSIPNYDGWKAYLDGKEVNLSEYNIMYMGFPVTSGAHEIELMYETPLLKVGSLVSIISLLSFLIIEANKKRKNKI